MSDPISDLKPRQVLVHEGSGGRSAGSALTGQREDKMNSQDSVEVTFFVPCCNEAANVAGTLDLIRWVGQKEQVSYEAIVVDDGSSDGTSDVVRKYCEAHGPLPIHLCRNTGNRGVGYSYLLWAGKARGRYYLLVNGDNDIPREDIAAVVACRGKADIIVPYVENQKERALFRQIVSDLFTGLVSFLSGHRLRYYNGIVLHRTENVVRFRSGVTGFGYQAELVCRALNTGSSYLEMPFRTLAKQRNRSSVFRVSNILSVLGSLYRILADRLMTQFSRKKN